MVFRVCWGWREEVGIIFFYCIVVELRFRVVRLRLFIVEWIFGNRGKGRAERFWILGLD